MASPLQELELILDGESLGKYIRCEERADGSVVFMGADGTRSVTGRLVVDFPTKGVVRVLSRPSDGDGDG